ncbi:clumping factor B-like [Acipenser oxyrinchus oxyrinchus]|uniref:Clumping factor B-like n=1 Tax=Acipenser oxyrinchus oxyrinchus TaxID=40147 RepID=A0AAD8GHT3_ACIOX|nr:clumping factor B-like [Acipenser oxyrinchus oxyrinchus]
MLDSDENGNTRDDSRDSEDAYKRNRIKIFEVNHKSDEDDDSSDSETDEDASDDEDNSNEKEQEPEGSDSEDDHEDSEHEDSKEEDGNSSKMDARHYRRGDDGCEDSSDEYVFQDIGDNSYVFSEELLMHGDEPEEFQSW